MGMDYSKIKDGILREDGTGNWEKLSYTLMWKGEKLAVNITKDTIQIKNLTGGKIVEVEVAGEKRAVVGELKVIYG